MIVRPYLFLCILIMSCSIIHSQPNQWVDIGIKGISPKCMEFDDNNEIIIGTFYKGIYKTNLGEWQECINGIEDSTNLYEVVDIQKVPGTQGQYLAGLWSWFQPLNGYLYLTTDNCLTWNRIDCYPPGLNSGTMAFFIDPADSSHWIWAGFTFEIYHSFNSGMDWDFINTNDNPGVVKFTSIPSCDSVFFSISVVGERVIPNMGGIERSSDYGRNWTSVWNGPYPLTPPGLIVPGDIMVDPFTNNHLIVVNSVVHDSLSDYRWMESFDYGLTWQPRIINFPSLGLARIAFDANEEGLIYLGTHDQGLFKSEDGGVSWVNISGQICRGRPVLLIYMDSAGNVYTSIEPLGLYKSSNSGETWEHITENFPGSPPAFFLDMNDDNIIYGTARLLLGTENNWTRIDNGIPLNAGLEVQAVFVANWIYAGTCYQSEGLNLWYSDNFGSDWYPVANQPAEVQEILSLDKDAADYDLVFKTLGDRVWTYSINNGGWLDITPEENLNYLDDPKVSPAVSGLWYISGEGYAYKTLNYGGQWTLLNLPNIQDYLWKILPDPINADIVYAFGTPNSPYVSTVFYRSLNGGQDWVMVYCPGSSIPYSIQSLSRFSNDPEVVIAGATLPFSTLISYDGGLHFQQYNEGLTRHANFYYLKPDPIDGSTIFAATSDGIKKINWQGNNVEGDYSFIPQEIKLYYPFPNPFNSSTVLSFDLRDAGFVELTVYDITGSEVARLVEGYRNVGYHEAVFDASELASGVYFARLNTGDFHQTKKLLLVK